MEIVSREEWGAADPTRIELTEHRELYLHHTVGSGARDKDGDGDLGDDYTKDVQTYHMSKGWDDIAYNFLIDPDGLEVYEGQGWGREPNAQAGHNHGTFAVAVMGDFSRKTPAPELLDKIAELIRYGQELGHLPDVPLQGHRDAPGSEGNECPGGHLYAKLGEINERIDMALAPEVEDFVNDMYKSAVLERGSNGRFAGYTVDHLRNHPSGTADSTARRIARNARDKINDLLGKLRNV